MAFNTAAFLAFLPAAFLLHAWAGERARRPLLLALSLGFYAALGAPHLLVALALTTLLSWRVGLGLARAAPAARGRWLAAGVAGNLAVLLVVKYLPGLVGRPGLWISVGVSYFVFQAIAYLVDVHLEVTEAEPSLPLLALSLAFFPKLLQGPIERSGELLPQLRRPWAFDEDEVRAGLLRFGAGLFRKVVVADRLGLYVDAVYADPGAWSGTTLLLATYAYALQLYFDFSGYTDMALGAARLFGVRLTENFRDPYLATSVADFWRRWHVSFSRWILDYLFRPLQLAWRDAGSLGTAAALLVAFLLSGLWHGASWTFLLWGLVHGGALALEVLWRPWQRRVHRALRVEKTRLLAGWQRLVTFHLVCLAWVFFRAPSLDSALAVLRGVPSLGRPALEAGRFDVKELGVLAVALPAAWLLSRAVPATPAGSPPAGALGWARPLRWTLYASLACAAFFLHVRSAGFIYFGF